MTVTIETGQNFCCEVFVGLYAGDELSDVELAPGLWASRGLPVVPGEHWERWLGELAFRDIKTSLVLTATAGQPEPGIVINQTLKDRLNLVSIGLDLQGALSHQQGFVISGSKDNGEPDARQFSRKRPSYASRNAKPLRVGISELKTALDLAAKLEKINVKGEDWRRVRRGIDVLRKAAEEPTLQDAHRLVYLNCRILEFYYAASSFDSYPGKSEIWQLLASCRRRALPLSNARCRCCSPVPMRAKGDYPAKSTGLHIGETREGGESGH